MTILIITGVHHLSIKPTALCQLGTVMLVDRDSFKAVTHQLTVSLPFGIRSRYTESVQVCDKGLCRSQDVPGRVVDAIQ